MKASVAFSVLVSAAASATPLQPLVERQGSTGTGPYPAKYTTDPGLPNHTIYVPQNLNAVNGTMPVVVWGNGACSANGLSQANFLTEIASWGFIAIASGGPNQQGSTTAAMMKASIDFASSSTSGVFAKVNKNAIAAAGWSCGGVEAYEQAQDARVKALGIFNSGQMSEDGTRKVVPYIKGKPVFYFLGGPSDIAYNNGMRDYRALSSGVPSWNGNLPVGHGGTYDQVNGGKFGKAAQLYFRWVLKGDTSVSSFFTGDGARADGWTVERKDLDKIKV
ncbi:uncharacterized protein EI97DRAFT_455503 [Westerdykella ornata]|uniref:Alpha/beta-hydrolase n=1 Tax=Westerdykella ornata TaxID=318751 RepID=A0A6A6JTR2_WESOR|nr:uncharacterized protein EI97DRAFT_455503 [Westerdykella ornata]KAF2279228.1 hypothetical protein EI97DRAFT_455503 [Westerdykella ornata]